MDNQTLLAEIKKLVLPLQEGQERALEEFSNVNKRLDNIEQNQAHANTALEAVAVGQNDLKEDLAGARVDIHDLGAKTNNKIKDHEKRIHTLEDEVGLPHPHKNQRTKSESDSPTTHFISNKKPASQRDIICSFHQLD